MSDILLTDQPSDRVLESLSPRVREVFRCVWQLADDGADKRTAVLQHLCDLEAALSRNEFLDIDLARRLAAQNSRLCDWLDGAVLSDHERALGRAAVCYFVLTEDGDSDADSIMGLEDDAEVIAAVARELGCVEVVAD